MVRSTICLAQFSILGYTVYYSQSVASYVIFTLIPPPRLHIKLSEVAITFTCSIPMSVLIPCHLSLQLLPTVAYTGYTVACIVAYILYVYNWQLAVMNRIPQGRSVQCIVTLPLIRNFWYKDRSQRQGYVQVCPLELRTATWLQWKPKGMREY